jgi:phage terminase Nu1 subunit (DNA packaging protein)
MSSELMDRKELAAWFKVSLPTIDRWIREGVPCMKPSPGVVRFELSEVVEWAKNGGSASSKAAG